MNGCFPCCTGEHTIEIVNFDQKITIQPPHQERVPEWKERSFNKIVVVMPSVMSRGYPANSDSPVTFDPKYWNPFKHQPAIVEAPRLSSMNLDGQPVASSDPGPARGVAEYLALMNMTVANQNYVRRGPGEGMPPDNVQPLPEDQASGSGVSSGGPEHGKTVPSGPKVSGTGRRPQNLELVNLARQDQGSQQTKTRGHDCAETNV